MINEEEKVAKVGSQPRGATTPREELRMDAQKLSEEWSAVCSGNSRRSWDDEVEAEDELVRKPSIWEKFDITKLSNAGFKLEYVAPTVHGTTPVCSIDMGDISTEIEFWKNSVVCYVLGAHPPFAVLNGFIQRIWSKWGINKVVTMKNGIVLVKFNSADGKDEAI